MGGYDLVVIAREKSNGRTYQEIENALLSLLKNHHLIWMWESHDEKNID